jgi:hypothetical protein
MDAALMSLHQAKIRVGCWQQMRVPVPLRGVLSVPVHVGSQNYLRWRLRGRSDIQLSGVRVRRMALPASGWRTHRI